MPHEVQGVVARAKGAPVSLETVLVPDPGPGEALVQVQACGVCHTDLHYREGGINDDFPFLLGHEAAGVVEAVGDGVTDVAPGDFVILNWRAVCGQCRACRRGRPWYCFATHNATQKMTLADGTALQPGAGHRRVRREDAGRRRPVHQGRPGRARDRRRAARLRRDGRPRRGDEHRQRAARRQRRRHRLRRRGQRRDRRCRARRRHDGHRRRRRRPQAGLGQGLRRDPHGQLPQHRPGRGDPASSPAASAPTSSSTRSGGPRPTEQAFYARDLAGTVVLVGVPTPDMTIELPLLDVFGRGGALKSSLVRRLPAQPRLPDADRPVPAGPARPRRASCRRRSASATSRRRSTRCTRGEVLRSVVVL